MADFQHSNIPPFPFIASNLKRSAPPTSNRATRDSMPTINLYDKKRRDYQGYRSEKLGCQRNNHLIWQNPFPIDFYMILG
jgi:hypothetical protein